MKTHIKICGIKFYEESKVAFENGADFIGLLVDIPGTNLSHKQEDAKKIIDDFSGKKIIVLTIKNDQTELMSMINYLNPWGVQLLRPDLEILKFLSENTDIKIIPVIHITDSSSIDLARSFYKYADYILLDSKTAGQLGGTGKVHDWDISKEIVDESPVPIFLAGGLRVDNVREAIDVVKPYAVDVDSGLRNGSGFRDLEKVKSFISKVNIN